ncbi:MAG TPA: carboxylating nicotinate-nucleotide diphosphorylase, partial [Sphingobacteriaceae bacterium]|nr:carboxylating nicotinate-nucleotide diphosphorylase [Sphingobacteriaceae bacterium]
GLEEGLAVFHHIDPNLNIEIFIKDGEPVRAGDVPLVLTGSIHSILKGERVALNIMQRMSGIATMTSKISALIQDTHTQILDTRKTTPLLRFLEKKAVRLGGGVNHRFGLYDMILIKDNHVDYAGGIQEAISAANEYRSTLSKEIEIEIEVRDAKELDQVLEIGQVDRIMLDNHRPEEVAEAVKKIGGRFVSEASGGIDEHSVRAYALAGVDYISIGGLTHSVKSLDISLKAKLVD